MTRLHEIVKIKRFIILKQVMDRETVCFTDLAKYCMVNLAATEGSIYRDIKYLVHHNCLVEQKQDKRTYYSVTTNGIEVYEKVKNMILDLLEDKPFDTNKPIMY